MCHDEVRRMVRIRDNDAPYGVLTVLMVIRACTRLQGIGKNSMREGRVGAPPLNRWLSRSTSPLWLDCAGGGTSTVQSTGVATFDSNLARPQG